MTTDLPLHRLNFSSDQWEEIQSLLDNVMRLEDDPAVTGLPRSTWIAVAQMAMGKAQMIDEGYYDDPNEYSDDDEEMETWALDLYAIFNTITRHFKPGDGNI